MMPAASALPRRVVTAAPLTGSILSGITRESVLRLALELGCSVEEQLIDVDNFMDGIRAGKVTEAFGSGTAAVITPVGKLCYKDESVSVGTGGVGILTQKLYDILTGIQTGKLHDSFGWLRKIA